MRTRLALVTALLCADAITAACAQDYPAKPVRIITAEAGGGADLLSRIVAQGIAAPLGQPVIVDNRGPIAIEMGARALADGYSFLVYPNTVWVLPFMRKTAWDPVRDFSLITIATRAPNILVVHPSVAATTVKELIALAKAKPGALNYADASVGSIPHLTAELFKAIAGVNMVHIPYKGSGPAFNALFSGEVQVMFPNSGSAAPHIKAGRLRALAVTTLEPTPIAPGLPTVAASGLPGFESAVTQGVFAPAKTPQTIIRRLNREIVAALSKPEVRERLFALGLEVVANTPEEFAATMKIDMAKWGKVIKDAAIRAD